MKIVVVGATGTIGSALVYALQNDHEVIAVGNSRGDYQVDMTSEDSIRELMGSLGHFDSLAVTAGNVAFNSLQAMTSAEWQKGVDSKLMGQINLVRYALKALNENGSITLTSGIIAREPIPKGISACTVNGAVNHFVKAASLEMPRGIRINCVSPTVLKESSATYGDFFPGFIPVPASTVAQAYKKSIMGIQNGRIFEVD
ncbi:short chain dehydrogenase [Endozoicomonas numazuensis]|uniref:Short-chain dehydrogenase n=1 Tax=Endozoicomonas numazuensis TaxID=1137799 RepID=A0A081NME9_9GAMM|nr:short chain dehydrogenase [Endozoicomonas numazuensis]KEQ19622.1 short-chain dehydrogenase [Endozoicomonas numazuensis]